MPLTVNVEVPPRDREVLASWVRSPSIRAGLAQRARIVLLAADGVGTNEIARRAGVSKPTVILWKKRYAAEGTGGLEDRPKPGKPRTTDDVAIVLATLAPPPKRLGVTHWSSRLLAAELGLSNVKVAKVWREWGLQPWRTESFKFSTDPQLEAKVRDVIGLYLNPPDKAVVLCVDEKPQAQALERAAPVLPLRPGIPEKRSHDYIRHGTTTLFAALEVATGKVTDACYPRHRHEEFLLFLRQVTKAYPRRNLHIVADNYGTHNHPSVRAWLARHPRITPALHTDVRIVAEHGGDLLFDHHPPGHPPRQLHLGQGPHRRDRELHRRVERALPPVYLDQDRRGVTPALQAR
jgi:transposase